MAAKRQKLGTALESPVIVDDGALSNLAKIRVLVVGAGGLGCEILKNLAASGLRQIEVIDMDTIELTNLNRQFLFTDEDIGSAKATIAAARVQELSREAHIKAHVARIEDMPDSFYENFEIVVSGLDSIQARRWLNAKLVELCMNDPSPQGLRPLIDGGSEGFRGQARVILPGITPCYECTLDLVLTGQAAAYPLCTIASVPRLPEHCIEWAHTLRWPQVFGSRQPDFDNSQDMLWMLDTATTRANEFGIEGVTLELVYGVLKRIIPSIASTNAIIAASCCLEAWKLATGAYDPIDNYFMYTGDTGVFSNVFAFERRENCHVCGTQAIEFATQPSEHLEDLLKRVQVKFQTKNGLPSVVSADGKTLYMSKFASLRKQTEQNLKRTIKELELRDEEEIIVTHSELPGAVRLVLKIECLD